VGKKKYAAVEAQMWPMIDQAETLRTSLTRAITTDAAAFDAILAAGRLPKTTPEEQAARADAMQRATLHAAEVPLETAEMALEVMALAVQAATYGNLNAISDAASAAALSRASLTGASLNVRINLQSLPDSPSAAAWIARLAELESQAASFDQAIQTALRERAGLA